jgi:hypothetical protein
MANPFSTLCVILRIPEQIPRMYSPKSSVTMDHLLPKSGTRPNEALTVSMIQEQHDMETEPDYKTSTQVPTKTFEPSIPYRYNDPPSPDQPAFKAACVEPPSSLSVFSPNAPQVETIVPEIELVSYDMAFANVKRPLLFPEGDTMDTTTDGPVTRSHGAVLPEPSASSFPNQFLCPIQNFR